MIILRSKKFEKQYSKLPKQVQKQFTERLRLFVSDKTLPALRIHALQGKYVGYWSMNVNGDIRAIYKEEGDEIYLFALIGSHSQLY